MTMTMPDDKLAAYLAAVKARRSLVAAIPVTVTAYAANPQRDAFMQLAHVDSALLLAAIERVLELHHPVEPGAGAQCKGCATHVTFTRWPCKTYLAITAELTKGEGGDGS